MLKNKRARINKPEIPYLMNQHKTLILKIGYSEILDQKNNSRKVSLGDILRTTPILHLYKDHSVTWVTDEQAMPLLEGNPLISRLLPYDFTTAFQLESEEFDTVINLEKIPGICALADKIKSRRNRYGFTFNTQTGEAEAYEKAYDVLAVSADPVLKKENERTFQDLLFEMVGAKWKNEGYVLGYKPQKSIQYDVALNTQIGQKWPTKAWPTKNWDELEQLLTAEGLEVTRQDQQDKGVLTDLKKYMDWINSSNVVVSNDSLGLHLGIALGKNTLGLFGPTPHKEVHFYERGEALYPAPRTCMPCFKGYCETNDNCMSDIMPNYVKKRVLKYLK